MLFRVRKPFTWDGQQYNPGDAINIEEGHPRLRAMVEGGKHIIYDATLTEATSKEPDRAWGYEL